LGNDNQDIITDILKQQAFLKKRLDEEQLQLTSMAKRLWAQQEADKANLSRELHDGIGQLLTALTRRLSSLGNRDPEFVELAEIANMALEDVRHLSRMMSPTILDDLGLKPALKWLCRSLFEDTDMQCDCQVQLHNDIADDLSTLVFRISQEVLTNALKHSGAAHISLSLQSSYNSLLLEIRDDGNGFDYEQVAKGVGLTSIADRAKAFDAKLNIISRPGKGTQTRVTIPL